MVIMPGYSLPKDTFIKENLPKETACLEFLHKLVLSAQAPEFLDLLLLHFMKDIPDHEDKVIQQLELAFKSGSIEQNKVLLRMTNYSKLLIAYMRSKPKSMVISLIKDFELEQKLQYLSLCEDEVREEVIEELIASEEQDINENEVTARIYFGMHALKKTDNGLSNEERDKIFNACEKQINASMKIIDTDFTSPTEADNGSSGRFILDYPLLYRIRSPHELMITALSASDRIPMCFSFTGYSIEALYHKDQKDSNISFLATNESKGSLEAFTLQYKNNTLEHQLMIDVGQWSVLEHRNLANFHGLAAVAK